MQSHSLTQKKLTKRQAYNSNLNRKFYESDPNIGSSNELSITQYGFEANKIVNPTRYYLLYKSQLQIIKNFIPYSESKRILDVGCGDGTILKYVKVFNSYTGVDISSTRIKRCKKKFNSPKINFIKYDIVLSFPFKNNIFDVVIASEIIEHVPDPIFFLQECKRVLKKDGVLILSTPISRRYIEQTDKLYNEQHLYIYSLKQLIFEIQKNGFKIKKMKGIGFHFYKIILSAKNPILRLVFYVLKLRKPKMTQYERCLNISTLDNPKLNQEYHRAKKNIFKKIKWFIKLYMLNLLGKIAPKFSEQVVVQAIKI